MKKKISIHDVARHLNVSATTVSFVLNGKAEEKKISSAVVKKVLEHVEAVGYRPNHIAQSLRTGKSKIIGMLVEDIADPFFSSIARIIEENLYELGYKIFHSSTNNNTSRAKALLQIFRERQVDGYIIAPTPGIETDIASLLNESKPLVLFDRCFPQLHTNNVMIDNKGGAYAATKHLFDNGFRNIAFVTLNSAQVQMNDRLKGYARAMDEVRLTKHVHKIAYNSGTDRIAAEVKQFLQETPAIDGVVFATNYLAVGGLQAFQELGLVMPDDIGMVGFDDNTHYSLFSPSITAVAQPVEEMSKQTVELLIKALTTDVKSKKGKTTVLPTQLIVRESSRPAKRKDKSKSAF